MAELIAFLVFFLIGNVTKETRTRDHKDVSSRSALLLEPPVGDLITFLVALQLLFLCTVSADNDNFIVPDGVSGGGAAWGGRSSLVVCNPPNCCKFKCFCCRAQLNKPEDAFAVLDGGRTEKTPGGGAAFNGGVVCKNADGGGAALGSGAHKFTGGGKTGATARNCNFTMPAGGKTDAASKYYQCRPPNCCKYKCSCCTEQLDKRP